MIDSIRGEPRSTRTRVYRRPWVLFGLTIVAAVGLAAPNAAQAQTCPASSGGTTGGTTETTGGGTSSAGGTTSASTATSALAAVQSAQQFVQFQQQRNLQYRQYLERNRALYLASIRSNNTETKRTRRVSVEKAQARREERRRLREERIARNLDRLNRIREEIEAAKTNEAETRVASVGGQ